MKVAPSMLYQSQLLQDGRYGIFINGELSATIVCGELCQKLIKALEDKVIKHQKEGYI